MDEPHQDAPRIAGVLLAAGASTRMGFPKALLPWEGEPLVRRLARVLGQGPCSDVFVIVGDEGDPIRAALQHLSARTLLAPRWKEGMGASLADAVSVLRTRAPACDAVLVALCDQPRVTPELLESLVAERARTGRPMAACRYAGTLGPPAIFDRLLFEELEALGGDRGAKQLLLRDPDSVAVIDFPEGAADLDTPEDVAARRTRPGARRRYPAKMPPEPDPGQLDDTRPVRPDGLEVRRRRHERGWGPRDLIAAIGRASERATGMRETISPQLLAGIEERGEIVPYTTLCLVAGGLECDPVDILREQSAD